MPRIIAHFPAQPIPQAAHPVRQSAVSSPLYALCLSRRRKFLLTPTFTKSHGRVSASPRSRVNSAVSHRTASYLHSLSGILQGITTHAPNPAGRASCPAVYSKLTVICLVPLTQEKVFAHTTSTKSHGRVSASFLSRINSAGSIPQSSKASSHR